jgi:AbrB family looped-hinge helix DNA binding protein
MHTVILSPKYQIVIPKAVREALHLRPGQKMQVIEHAGRVELIPERDIKELRGFLKGINTEFKREEDRCEVFPQEIKMANQSIHRTLVPLAGDLFVSPQSYGIGRTRKLR